ncbi:MAG: DUF3828 domain-containing protein [Pyrinomonadaceae bacterium]
MRISNSRKSAIGAILRLSICTLLLTMAASLTSAQAVTPEETAKRFYKWYLRELNIEGGNPVENKHEMRKFVSARVYRWIYSKAYEEYGADYFIDAQDFAPDWEKNIRISGAVTNANAASMRVTLHQAANKESQAWDQILDLKFIKEQGVWKIDRITGKH